MRSAPGCTERRSSNSNPSTAHTKTNSASPSITLKPSARNFTEPTESGLDGSPCDSHRTKNAIATIAPQLMSDTTARVVALTRRALVTAINSSVKPAPPNTRNSVARKPCFVNGKKKSEVS